jgi:5-hydroxyisourate hydrolase
MADPGTLTTHVLDAAGGRPAAGIEVSLYQVVGSERELLCTRATNSDGRTDPPLLAGGDLVAGTYELTFAVGDYLVAGGAPSPPFLDVIPVRFTVTDADAGHHVPLLLSPYHYSVYRGS